MNTLRNKVAIHGYIVSSLYSMDSNMNEVKVKSADSDDYFKMILPSKVLRGFKFEIGDKFIFEGRVLHGNRIQVRDLIKI